MQIDLSRHYLKLMLQFLFSIPFNKYKVTEVRVSLGPVDGPVSQRPALHLSLEDLSLGEGFAHVLELALPGQVLSHHGLALLAGVVQLAPAVRLVVDLPVVRELRGRRRCGSGRLSRQ